MSIKITTIEQVASLKTGDVLQKSAPYRLHERVFGRAKTQDPITYEIKNINRKNNIINFEVRDDSALFSWPSDLKRINIKVENLLDDDTWWIST
jgi:hypothetical protein